MERIAEPELMDLPAEAAAYAKADFAEVNHRFVQRCLEVAGDRRAARVLDLGAGPGDIAVRLARARPDWCVIALDASAAMLQIASQRLVREQAVGAHLALADAKRLPFAARSFDLVISNSIIHHITDTAALWSQVRRVARSGAGLFMRDLMRPESPRAAQSLVELHAGGESPLLREEFFRSLLSAYSVTELAGQLRAAGIADAQVTPVSDRHLDVVGTIA